MSQARFSFHVELNDFLALARRSAPFDHSFMVQCSLVALG
jgi:hypothetical protein